jgi:polyphosphate kinase
VVGLKTHAKMLLVTRRERVRGRTRLVRYAHLGTGNYHAGTARLYTDFGLLTAHPGLCGDVEKVFRHLTSLTRVERLKHFWLAPFDLHRHLLDAIARETRHARAGKPARIVARMNALGEESIVRALYAASQAGVKVDLIVRGACVLRPGVKGVSDNIRVRSVIGRFLEHSRVFWFRNAGADDVYLSSADWLGRNLFRRIEIAFPVLDPALKRRVIEEGLKVYLDDRANAWRLGADGQYRAPSGGAQAVPAQTRLVERLAQHDA